MKIIEAVKKKRENSLFKLGTVLKVLKEQTSRLLSFWAIEFSRSWNFPGPGNFHGAAAGLVHGNFQVLEISMG